eukprot:TRINITY_DN15884_c0_g2_i1.p1 TRINITY_DN15884_c0_g2~~TRINITY_DN15884_c0_g2_i1.p1  ORF type:complete len:434 (+),score=59.44 TRINITY_DN15884_c0_g2_i1:129-1430(+)
MAIAASCAGPASAALQGVTPTANTISVARTRVAASTHGFRGGVNGGVGGASGVGGNVLARCGAMVLANTAPLSPISRLLDEAGQQESEDAMTSVNDQRGRIASRASTFGFGAISVATSSCPVAASPVDRGRNSSPTQSPPSRTSRPSTCNLGVSGGTLRPSATCSETTRPVSRHAAEVKDALTLFLDGAQALSRSCSRTSAASAISATHPGSRCTYRPASQATKASFAASTVPPSTSSASTHAALPDACPVSRCETSSCTLNQAGTTTVAVCEQPRVGFRTSRRGSSVVNIASSTSVGRVEGVVPASPIDVAGTIPTIADTPSTPLVSSGLPSVARSAPRSPLLLPVTLRRGSPEGTAVVPPTLPMRRPGAIARERRLPARLQMVDDETVLPRDFYNQMLRLGDEARGRFGYAQHRLVFVGEDGKEVLRLSPS